MLYAPCGPAVNVPTARYGLTSPGHGSDGSSTGIRSGSAQSWTPTSHTPVSVSKSSTAASRAPDYAVEATNRSNVVAQAVEALGTRGACAMAGGAARTATVKRTTRTCC